MEIMTTELGSWGYGVDWSGEKLGSIAGEPRMATNSHPNGRDPADRAILAFEFGRLHPASRRFGAFVAKVCRVLAERRDTNCVRAKELQNFDFRTGLKRGGTGLNRL